MKTSLPQHNYRELLDNISGVIYTTDIRGQIEFASAGVYALTGYTPEELVGQHFSFLVEPEYLTTVYDHYASQIKTETRETHLEFYSVSRTGEKKWVEQTALLLHRNDGTKGFQCFVRDISEKQKMQQQLIVAKTEAEEARKMQELFLANMSHEIRTPMNGIVGMTNLLLETPLSAQQEQFAGVIHRSADNLLVIIDDILDLSKIKAGKLTIEKIGFQLQDVTANIWALFEARILKKGLKFEIAVDPNIPASLVGDPHRLNQVLINLVGNAVKFTENGKITVSIKLEKQANKIVHLLFTVADTGIGIAPDQVPYVFDSFSQAASDTTRKYGGTGLGLTICQQLLALQGGSISVTSETAKGTTFSFRIPYGSQSSATINTQAAKTQQVPQQQFAGKHFLVVEDNAINQQLIEYVIKKAGAQVTMAGHGGEAVEQLKKQKFDLIIMDLQMPVMDGYETTKYVRNHLKLRTPILAMTANALKGEQVRCLEVGMDGYMSKPFEFRDFYNRVSLLLEKSHECRRSEAAKESKDREDPKDPQLPGKQALFNLSLLEEVGDRDYVRDTLTTFLDALPDTLNNMQDAFCEKNYDHLAFLAHKLRGTMGVFQARTLAEQLDQIEQLSREKTDPGGLLPITLNLLRKLAADLQKYDCFSGTTHLQNQHTDCP